LFKPRVMEIRLPEGSRATLSEIAAHYGIAGLSPATVVQLLIQEKADEIGIAVPTGLSAFGQRVEA